MNETDLHDLLARSTDRIEGPALGSAALASATRRRKRHRVASVAAAAGAVAGVVLVVQLASGAPRSNPPGPPPSTEVPTSTTTSAPSEPTQAKLDPRGAEGLPDAPAGIASALPDRIAPPPSAPSLASAPIPAAVAAIEQDGVVSLLSPAGDWRRLEVGGETPFVALSPSGTRLAVWEYTDIGHATVYDLGSGGSITRLAPAGYHPFDASFWVFLTDQRLLLTNGSDRAFVVDLPADSTPSTGYGSIGSLTADPDGVVLTSADFGRRPVLTDYRTEPPRTVSMAGTGRLHNLQATRTEVLGTTYDGRPFQVVVADRAHLVPRAVLAVHDDEAAYSNGGLSTLTLTDDGVALLRVARLGRHAEGFDVVAWDTATGSVWHVSRVEPTAQIDFAEGLLRR